MVNVCPLCRVRVSDWMMACGKTKEIGPDVVHKACLIDHELRTGRPYEDDYYAQHPDVKRRAS